MSGLFAELKRRNVFRLGIFYLVAGWLLLQVTDVVAGVLGLPEWTLRLVAFLLALGLPVAIILAWIFEITPEGLKRERDVVRDESIAGHTGKKLTVATVVLLVVAVGFLAWDRSGTTGDAKRTTPSGTTPSIAVLPFLNMSSDPEQDYFSDGITEDLLNLLTRIDGLAVASRTSSFAFRGETENLADIARTLGVDYILEGSVRKSSDRVRITAQLIDAATDRHLWSESYDRQLTDIFAIQDEISNAIVAALGSALGVEVRRTGAVPVATTDMDAYELYLKARELFIARKPEGLRESIRLYERAIERDADFARAYEGLAAVWSVIPSYPTPEGFPRFTRIESEPIAFEAARKALAIDPSLSLPHAVLGSIHVENGRWEEALEEYDRAIAIDDRDATIWLWRGLWAMRLGYLGRAVEDLRVAHAKDPTTGIYNDHLANALRGQGHTEEAMPYFRVAFEQGRNVAVGILFAQLESGQLTGATLAAADLLGGRELLPYFMRIFDGSTDRQRAIRRFVRKFELDEDSPDWLKEDPRFFASLGDYDRAIDMLTSTGPGSIWKNRLWQPQLRGFRKTPQFKELMRDLGMEAYWRKHGWPDLCRPLGEDGFECD